MFMNFKSAKELVLTKLYEQIYTSDENEYFFVTEIRSLTRDEFSAIFAKKVIADLVKDQHLEEFYFQDDNENGYTITAKGISAAERIYARAENQPADLVAVPAADRLVTIAHNQPEINVLAEAIDNAAEAVRSSNTVSEDEKSWINSHLRSGAELIRRCKVVSLSAIKSLLLSPLSAALKAVSEEQLKSVLTIAVKAIRNWIGY